MTRSLCPLTDREGPYILRCTLHTGHPGPCIADTVEVIDDR